MEDVDIRLPRIDELLDGLDSVRERILIETHDVKLDAELKSRIEKVKELAAECLLLDAASRLGNYL